MAIDWGAVDKAEGIRTPASTAGIVDVDWNAVDLAATGDNDNDVKASMWKQFTYGFDKALNLSESASVLADMYIEPMGRILWDEAGLRYQSPEEFYGKGADKASSEELRKIYMTTRSEWLGKKYPELSIKDAESATTILGEFAGHMASPEMLIPFGGSALKAGAGIGALSGTIAVAEDLVRTGQVDPERAVLATSLGFVGGAGIQHVMNTLKELPQKSAQRLVKRIEERWTHHSNTGLKDQREISRRALMDVGVLEESVIDITETAGRKLVLKKTADAAEKLSNTSLAGKVKERVVAGLEKGLVRPLDPWIGVLSTRLAKHSQAVANKVRKYEATTHIRNIETYKKLQPFTKAFSKLPAGTQAKITLAARAGNKDVVMQELEATGNQSLKDNYEMISGMLEDMATEMKQSGLSFNEMKNYMPLSVKDYDGLVQHRGIQPSEWKKIIAEAEARKGEALTDEEAGSLMNNLLAGKASPDIFLGGTNNLKNRKIKNVTEDLLPYYHSLPESINRYFDHAIHAVEKRNLFGKVADDFEPKNNQLERSLGYMLHAEKEAGRLTEGDVISVKELLRARFGPGERAGSHTLRSWKQVLQAMLLANPVSAATQLGDLGIAAFANGFRNTAATVVKTLLKRNEMSMEDAGFSQAIHEFTEDGKAADFLRWSLKWSGFSSVDRLGKTTIINSSLKKYRKWAKTPEGIAKIRQKFGAGFFEEAEMNQIIKDLQPGRPITGDVKMMLASDVADVQPVYLSELPQKFLEVPNGRLFYTLKSFTIKQLDIMRRNIFQEIKKGNVTEGTANLMRFGFLFTAANMSADQIKQWMLGREVKMEDDFVANLWKVTATNEYNVEQWKKGNAGTAIMGMTAMPFASPADVVGQDLVNAGQQFNSLQYVPLFGKILHNWFGGGLEKWDSRQPAAWK